MAGQHAHDTPGLVEFLRRYSPFGSGGNLLIYDRQLRVMAVEKTSHNYFEAFTPDANGHSHISGMVCRDPGSPQARYVTACREEYRRLYNLPADGPDAMFWQQCDALEKKLVTSLAALGRSPKFEDVARLFVTPWPDGLRKAGTKFHPDQGLVGYTLCTKATLLDERRYFRWQLSADGRTFSQEPEICRYA